MKSILVALLLILSGSLAKPQPEQPPIAIEQQHATTHRIAVYDVIDGGEVGHCSATAVGPHALLTAQHCFTDSNEIRIDQDTDTAKISSALLDGKDHVIYIVDKTFTTWSDITERPLVAKEPVHMWGNPGKNSDVYRDGFFVEMKEQPQQPKTVFFFLEIPTGPSRLLEHFILPIYPGDSGSGIFDAKGAVVSVVSLGNKSADCFNLPLAFTQDQLNSIAPEKK